MSIQTLAIVAMALVALVGPATAESFTNFESGHVRPLALSPDGAQLFAVNTSDNRLAIYDVTAGGLTAVAEVPVGLEPVAVAARTNTAGRTEAWVVNFLSDSISIVEINPDDVERSRVVRTLLVGDEPRDIVFAGSGGNRAFVTTARRGQNLPGSVAPNLTTPGTPRALVWAFDANNLGSGLGGTPLSVIELFGDTPRALAVSPDGATVYAAVFLSGNRTTAVTEPRVARAQSSPNGLPPAPAGSTPNAPITSLIVKFDGTQWVDELNRNWNNAVPLSLPDKDVFLISANANPPALAGGTNFVSGVGTVLFNMAVRPNNGHVFVTNTEARNEIRFETAISGHNAESRITVINGTTPAPRHLNPHINYAVPTGSASEIEASLAQPTDLVFSASGDTVYVAGFGSGKVGVFDANALEAGTISRTLIEVGLGPSGLAVDETHNRLYVMNRLDHSVSIVDLAGAVETARLPLRYDPLPSTLKAGRRFLYDARDTSGHGDNSCAMCHVFGDFDGLGWDLGNPFGAVIPNLIPKNNTAGVARIDFHPMKGPMTTQSLRGMEGAGAMHWRGDRNGGAAVDGTVTPGGDVFDEVAAFKRFNGAFVGLQGRASEISDAEMQAFTDFILTVRYPPNPIKALDNSDSTAEAAGRTLYTDPNSTIFGSIVANDGIGQTCQSCHAMPITTTGETALAGIQRVQEIKNPHLRNAYQKVGMFGVAANSIPNNFLGTSFLTAQSVGDQVRGFGFSHDGSVSTIFNFLNNGTFVFPGGATGTAQRQQLEAFVLAMDTGLRPIVGQQITLAATNGATVGPRIDLMLARAAAGDCDVVVKGDVGSEQRGWYRTAAGTFRSDRAAEPLLSDVGLRTLAAATGQELTYTAVPPGAALRMGVDRDEDGVFDRDELDQGSDPADATSTTPAATATATSTATATPSDTGTATASVTVTNTATPNDTATPTASVTASNTASPTATDSPMPTATETVTATSTQTPTATDTATPTSTQTPTATDTATPTSTQTATDTATATSTQAPTSTDTATATSTQTPTATDTPTATYTVTPIATGGCAMLPDPGCRLAGKSVLVLKTGADPGQHKLIWKWLKGAATLPAEFADPTLSTDYQLCLYTASGQVASASVPAGSGWSAAGSSGFKYGDSDGSSAGITKVLLKGGADGKAKILVKGRGGNLPVVALPVTDLPVTVQLRNATTTLCWSSELTTAPQNTSTQFKAKAP